MGVCTSVAGKKKETIIINNTLKNTKDNDNNNKSISKTLQLKIVEISVKSRQFNETIISIEPNKTIKELYSILKININYDYDIKVNEGQIITNININNKIIDILFPYVKNINIYEEMIYLSLIYKGLLIPENIIESYIEKNPFIGSPIFDNPDYFTIIIFNTKSKELKIFNYEQKSTEFPLLSKFNSFTAYCNANGYLYISGGENDQSEDFEKSIVEYNDFFCIDLNQLNLNINNYNNIDNLSDNDNILTNNLTNINEKNELNIKQLPNLLEPRTWHSMIFVPEKYIFIVGGSTKSVELYDIENNILTKDSELNEMRNECTLCMVNDIYLYAFCGFLLHQTFNCTIEKCNLRKEVRNWECVNFNMNNNKQFLPSFFCASYFKNGEIILVGGNDSVEEKNKSYVVKIGNDENPIDEINEFNNYGDEKYGVFRDKLFTPIDNNYAINIPLIYGEHIQLLLLSMDTGKIEQKFYNDIFNED